jgi:hypothetical protein
MKNTARKDNLGLTMKIGPEFVSVEKKATIQSAALTQLSNPVVNPPFNNWSVNQPTVAHAKGLEGKADLGQNIIIDGHAVHF